MERKNNNFLKWSDCVHRNRKVTISRIILRITESLADEWSRKQNGIYPQRVERGFSGKRTQVAFESSGNVQFFMMDGGEKIIYYFTCLIICVYFCDFVRMKYYIINIQKQIKLIFKIKASKINVFPISGISKV